MTKVNNFWIPKIDSLQVRVPICDVEIIDRSLIDRLITVLEDTGEVIDEKSGKHFEKETSSGLHFRIWARNRKDISESDIKSELYFLINAKHLKERYFEGITIDNVDLIRQEINSLNVISIDKAEFLHCEIRDVDFCFDFPCSRDDFSKSITDYYKKIAIVGKPDRVKAFGSKSNMGLSLNTRKDNTPKKPFTKFYHKGVELETKSVSFSDRFLKEIDFRDVARFEFSLQNRKYFKHYGIDGTKTLKQLLEKLTLQRVFQDVYKNWFIKRVIIPHSSKQFRDIMLQAFFEVCKYDQIEEVMYRSLDNCVNYDQPKKIRKYYHEVMQPLEQEKKEEYNKELHQKLDIFFGVPETERMMFGQTSSERREIDPLEIEKITKQIPF